MVLRAALLAATMMVVPAALAQANGELKMVDEMQAATLKVPGATLYYEVRGKGPLLVIIPGGPEDAGVFAELAAGLADTHRVVAIDPRGNSRSMFDAAPAELDLGVPRRRCRGADRRAGWRPGRRVRHVRGRADRARTGAAASPTRRHPGSA